MSKIEPKQNFYAELVELINKHSVENGSDTPDYVLAYFITECLKAWTSGVRQRDQWYGCEPWKNNAVIDSATDTNVVTTPPGEG